MNKTILGLLLAVVWCGNAQAAAYYGKYKMEILHEAVGTQEQIFLLNSRGEAKTIGGDDYLHEVETFPFFNQVTLEFKTWGDEDFSKFNVTLDKSGEKLEVISQCGAFIDKKNDWVMSYGWKNFQLSKWSKSKKKYIPFDNSKAEATYVECITGLLEGYEDSDGYGDL